MSVNTEININGIDIKWDLEKGSFTFFGIPSVLFWITPSLMTMLLPLADEVGHSLFRLLIAESASDGTEEDYHAMVTVLGDTFEEGFLKWGTAVSSAGWGTFELPHFDLAAKKARVRVSNTWELTMQKDLPERWGCPFIQGKIIGIFNHALNTRCWADEIQISFDPDNMFVEFDIYESPKTIAAEIEQERLTKMREKERILSDKVEQKTAELNEINAQLNHALSEAKQASNAKSEFLSSMSHELRTPMNAILGFAQVMQINPTEPLSEGQAFSVGQILKGGNHLLELIDQVLELNKIEAGKLSLNLDHGSLHDIISASLSLVQARAAEEGVTIVENCDDNLPAVLWTDSTRLTQVLINLLSNAVKYNNEGGTVTLSCRETPDQRLCISVADTGWGIPVDKQNDLFKPFERLGRETKEIEGTGIGLTITKQIIELLGGEVNFESEPGKGSTFWVNVPIIHPGTHPGADAQKAAPTDIETPLAVDQNERAVKAQHTILYVEDNPDNIRLIDMIVGQFQSTRLLTTHTAELGLDLAKSEKPDLILMDINLPGINGIEALKQLQNMPQTQDIPVIALTAAARPEEVSAGLALGFKNYLTKPLNVPEFIAAIEAVLGNVNKPV